MDPEELAVYRLQQRKHFEDRLRMNRNAIGAWIKYAAFEEAQRDFERARSVYERAIDVDHRNVNIWLKCASRRISRRMRVAAAGLIWTRPAQVCRDGDALSPREPRAQRVGSRGDAHASR